MFEKAKLYKSVSWLNEERHKEEDKLRYVIRKKILWPQVQDFIENQVEEKPLIWLLQKMQPVKDKEVYKFMTKSGAGSEIYYDIHDAARGFSSLNFLVMTCLSNAMNLPVQEQEEISKFIVKKAIDLLRDVYEMPGIEFGTTSRFLINDTRDCLLSFKGVNFSIVPKSGVFLHFLKRMGQQSQFSFISSTISRSGSPVSLMLPAIEVMEALGVGKDGNNPSWHYFDGAPLASMVLASYFIKDKSLLKRYVSSYSAAHRDFGFGYWISRRVEDGLPTLVISALLDIPVEELLASDSPSDILSCLSIEALEKPLAGAIVELLLDTGSENGKIGYCLEEEFCDKNKIIYEDNFDFIMNLIAEKSPEIKELLFSE